MNFEEERKGKRIFKHHYGRIEALQVSHLKNAAALPGEAGETLPGNRRCRYRLFNQYIDAAVEQTGHDVFMSNGRRSHNGGIKQTECLFKAGKCLRVAFPGKLPGSFEIGVDNRNEFDVLDLLDHADVISPERARSDHRRPKLFHSFAGSAGG